MAEHGVFSGDPKTRWLVNPKGDDRDMELLEDFTFTDPDGRVWRAPEGAVVNGASIPVALWSQVGSPYTGNYRRASIVHDVACGDASVSRKEADVMFFHACRAGGCGWAQAQVLYAGVRIGAWADAHLPIGMLTAEPMALRVDLEPPPLEDQYLQGKLAQISHALEALPEDSDIAALDAVIDQHLKH